MQIHCEHTVNSTLEFLKFVCHLGSFRNTIDSYCFDLPDPLATKDIFRL
jgi:hypothetical protein